MSARCRAAVAAWPLLLLQFCLAAAQVGGEASLGQVTGRLTIPARFSKDVHERGGLGAARIILNGGQHSVLPTADGHFTIGGLPAGEYLLQVVHPQLLFDPVHVVIAAKGDTMKTTAFLADMLHGKGGKLRVPLGLAPSDLYVYYEKQEEFNVLSIFSSPMMLMGLVSFGMVFLLPKMQPMLEAEKQKAAMQSGGGGDGDGGRGEERRGGRS